MQGSLEMKVFTLFLMSVLPITANTAKQQTIPQVQLECGSRVQGSIMTAPTSKVEVQAFEGIRYVKMPQRFALAQEFASDCDAGHDGIIDATRPGNMCAQPASIALGPSPSRTNYRRIEIYVLPVLACLFCICVMCAAIAAWNVGESSISSNGATSGAKNLELDQSTELDLQPLVNSEASSTSSLRLIFRHLRLILVAFLCAVFMVLSAVSVLALSDGATPGMIGDEEATSGMIGDEDCLFLNVYRPSNTSAVQGKGSDKLLPVMVWIHGGGYMIGTGRLDDTTYGSSLEMPAEGVVHVTLTYRLGPLGFLYLDDDGDDWTPNLGLQDQISALRWVKRNIHSFGGDPNSTLLYGHSAGGVSVMALQRMPQARSLFNAAASLSPLPQIGTTPKKANTAWRETIMPTGCTDKRCLLRLKAHTLATLTIPVSGSFGTMPDPTIANGRSGVKFVIADGITLTENWAVDVPLLISGEREQGDFGPPYEGAPAWPLNRTSFETWAQQAGIPADEIWPLYADAELPLQKWNQIGTDLTLFCGLRAVSEKVLNVSTFKDSAKGARRTSPIYLNIFDYAVPFMYMGEHVQYACEGIDIWLTFGTFDAPLGLPLSVVTPEAREVGVIFRSFLVNFARTAGEISPSLGDQWEPLPAVCEYGGSTQKGLLCLKHNLHARACDIYDKAVGRKFDLELRL